MTLQEAFAAQAEHCAEMGSPFMARLMRILAEHWPEASAIGRECAGFAGDVGPSGHSLPLRLAGGFHALVLKGKDRALMDVYPPNNANDLALRHAVLAALKTHEAFLLDWIDSAPQTNEVRRSAVLIAGARVAAQHFDLPIMLSELGASGGLNLMWDHYALNVDGTHFGPPRPALTLSPDWSGPLPPAQQPQIASRAGVDLNPLDPRREDHLLRLMAFLWADQPERLTMTRAAAALAQGHVARGDAIEWLEARLPKAPAGQLHLIQHTVAWQYFPRATQDRGRALIEAAGAQATRQRPLAWLSMESDGDAPGKRGAAITLRLWPGDITLDLGRADFHGRWIEWRGAC